MLMNGMVFIIILHVQALNVSLCDRNKQWNCVRESVETVSQKDTWWLITFWAGELFHQLNSTVHLFRRHQEAHNMIQWHYNKGISTAVERKLRG